MLEDLKYWACLNAEKLILVLVKLQSNFFFTFTWTSPPVLSLGFSVTVSLILLFSVLQGDYLFLHSEVCFSQRHGFAPSLTHLHLLLTGADKRLPGYNLKALSLCLYGTLWAGCEDFKFFGIWFV